MSLAIVRKISTAKVCGPLKPLLKDKTAGTAVLLYQVAGIARDFKKGESNFGPYTEFKGDFAALMPLASGNGVDVQKGYRSPKAFFPEPFSSMLESALSEAAESQLKAKEIATAEKKPFIASPASIQFKVNIFAKVDEASSTGYVYEVVPVMKVEESDALARLITADTQPALPPAPAPAPVVEHKAEPKTAPAATQHGKHTPTPAGKGKGK